MDASARLSWYHVLWLKIICGRYRTKTFRNYLHTCFQAGLYNIVLDKFSAAFIEQTDVLRYYHEHMKYRWTLRHKLGSLDLGSCTLSEALTRTNQHMPKSIIRHVDDRIHSIFLKTIAEGQSE